MLKAPGIRPALIHSLMRPCAFWEMCKGWLYITPLHFQKWLQSRRGMTPNTLERSAYLVILWEEKETGYMKDCVFKLTGERSPTFFPAPSYRQS